MNVLIQEDRGGVYDFFSGSPREVLNWLAGYCCAGYIASVFVGPLIMKILSLIMRIMILLLLLKGRWFFENLF